MQKKFIYFALGNGMGVATGILGGAILGYQYLFWFLGGMISGAFALLFLADKEKTNAVFYYTLPIIVGLVSVVFLYLMTLIGLDY